MTEPVVEIVGLSKRFGAGVLAVDDLSFAVEHGQVCGLLGPNGAGKTTCLRMLLGLIRPTAGETRLFGERVTPGTDAAASARRAHRVVGVRAPSVGHAQPAAVVGGGRRHAGPTPTSSRRWRSPTSATAIDRKVKTYSQGMRQRLGLARVLLGKPEVLVLDEPTNGLDPGEMREVRQLVRRVAEAGCDRAVLQPRPGRGRADLHPCGRDGQGQVGRRPARSTTSSERPGRSTSRSTTSPLARRVLEALPSVRRVDDEAPGLAVAMDGGRRSDLVAALVAAGIAVETVTARRRLEDAFLGLVEAL